MDPIAIAPLAFVLTFAGALGGMALRAVLPDDHVAAESKQSIQVTIGLIATMTAVLLGLVTTSAKGSFDAVDSSVRTTAIDLIALDRLLAQYGPETGKVREELKVAVADRIEVIWRHPQPAARGRRDPSQVGRGFEQIAAQVRHLMPQSADQQWLQSRARTISESLLEARWGLVIGDSTSAQAPFVAFLLSWLTITFVSFGLFAPRNTTVVSILLLCALSVASAVFLILEMDRPFDGFVTVSAEPMMSALAHLSQ